MRKIKFKIGQKIRLGFLTILVVSVFNGVYTLRVLDESIKNSEHLNQQIVAKDTTYTELGEVVRDQIFQLNRLVGGFNESMTELDSSLKNDYWTVRLRADSILQLSGDSLEKVTVAKTFISLDSLNNELSQLISKAMYLADDSIAFAAYLHELKMSKGINDLYTLRYRLNEVMDLNNNRRDIVKQDLLSSFEELNTVIIYLLVLSVILVVFVSIIIIKNITAPMKVLHEKISSLRLGIIPTPPNIRSTDEIGDMSHGIAALIDNFKKLKEFTHEIERGNLDINYELLSENDATGRALIAMRDNLLYTMEETDSVVNLAGVEGDLESRIDNTNKSGAWKELSGSINALLTSIAKPLLEIGESLKSLQNGKLSITNIKDTKGDIALVIDNLNNTIVSLNGILNDISRTTIIMDSTSIELQTSSGEMQTSCQEIANAMDQISQGSTEQLKNLNRVTNLIHNTSEEIKRMEEKLEDIQQASEEGTDNCQSGRDLATKAEECMSEINTYAESTSVSIGNLEERSKEISSVLGIIKDVASQTNLLALNAAIEAAQAGEYGRGFAVVAEEIRELAEQSKQSVDRIENFVSAIRRDTLEAVRCIETMKKSVTKGIQTTNASTSAFGNILNSANRTQECVESINRATEQQAAHFHEVTSFVNNVVVVSEQSAAGTEEIASSTSQLLAGMDQVKSKSDELTKVSSSLKEMVNKFDLLDATEQHSPEQGFGDMEDLAVTEDTAYDRSIV